VCQQNRDFSAAQDSTSPTPRRSTHDRRRSTSSSRRATSRRPSRSPKRDPSPGPPQLSREAAQPDEKEEGMSWADAQEQFSLGAEAMSQGSGSPINLLDPETCDGILQDLRRANGQLPDFHSVGSKPGSPPPALELEMTHGERGTQTSPALTHDKSTDVLAIPTSTSDQATQVLSRPHQGTSANQTSLLPPLWTRAHRSCSGPHDRWPSRRQRGQRPAVPSSGPRRTGQH